MGYNQLMHKRQVLKSPSIANVINSNCECLAYGNATDPLTGPSTEQFVFGLIT